MGPISLQYEAIDMIMTTNFEHSPKVSFFLDYSCRLVAKCGRVSRVSNTRHAGNKRLAGPFAKNN